MRLKFAVLAAAPALLLGAAIPRGAAKEDPTNNLRLVADLSDKRLKMFEADTLVWQYPISDGTAGYPTPAGEYRIRKLIWNPRWTPPPNSEWARKYKPQAPGSSANPMKVVKIFFREPDYYIHGTGDTASLGTAASHGCLRMDPDQAAEVGAIVMEHGGSAFGWDWIKRLLHIGETRTVRLKQPVTLRVDY